VSEVLAVAFAKTAQFTTTESLQGRSFSAGSVGKSKRNVILCCFAISVVGSDQLSGLPCPFRFA